MNEKIKLKQWNEIFILGCRVHLTRLEKEQAYLVGIKYLQF